MLVLLFLTSVKLMELVVLLKVLPKLAKVDGAIAQLASKVALVLDFMCFDESNIPGNNTKTNFQ